jgi:hypothetical protein
MNKYRAAFLLGLLLLGLLIALAVRPAASETSRKQVSSFQFDWDHHGLANFIFELPSAGDYGGADFTRIRVQVPGQKEFILADKDGWVDYSHGASVSTKLPKTLTPSDRVLALKVAANRTLLFLFGYGYASSFGRIDVLEISEAGKPRVVIHRKEFMLEEVRDLDGDGLAEVVGKSCMSQGWGNDLLTYDPFNIYKLNPISGGPAHLSLQLSERYNLKHYYGWAGPECSEDIAVVLHPPKGGKPIVVSKQVAEKMTAGNQ